MPTKKQKKAQERHGITLRFDDQEKALLDDDRRSIGGVPGSFSAYAKHAVNSYPKLRKLEEAARRMIVDGRSIVSECSAAETLLREAGLS